MQNIMRKSIIFLSLMAGSFFVSAFSQEVLWKAGVYSFFDNAEYGFSQWNIPQTMAGVHLAPEIGISWNEKHRAYAGFDALHEFGSDKAIDYFDPIVYYEFAAKSFRFYMGAFPRRLMADKFPRMFFQDSIRYYRSVINGIFFEYFLEKNYFNVWMDWTSRQTLTRRETFYVCWSGRYNLGVLYGQHFGFVSHYAGTMNRELDDGLHDNVLLLTSLGLDFSSKTNFEKLDANVGLSLGLERDRNLEVWNYPKGLLSEVNIEYRGLGLMNTYYNGQGQQVLYNARGSELYWGDSFYRSRNYDRTDLYICFYKSDVVNLKLMWSFHFTEQRIRHQQMFYASFDLNNLKKKEQKKYRYIWDNWF